MVVRRGGGGVIKRISRVVGLSQNKEAVIKKGRSLKEFLVLKSASCNRVSKAVSKMDTSCVTSSVPFFNRLVSIFQRKLDSL